MSTRRCSLAVKMIASCEMDHRSVDFFIHPRRSSFIDSNWLDQSRDLMFLPLIYYNSNFFFCIFCFAMPFFLQDFSASSTTSPWWWLAHTDCCSLKTTNRFFRLRLLHARIFYYITRTPTIRNFPLEHDVWGWMVEVDTNFKLFLCVTLLVFPISALFRFTSLCVHIDGRRRVMNSFRNSRLLKWFSAADCAESAFNDKHFAYNRISWPSTAVQGYFGPLPKYMPSTSMAAVAGEYFCFRFSVCFCLTNEPNRSCDQLKTS